jgi:hypothetical protein
VQAATSNRKIKYLKECECIEWIKYRSVKNFIFMSVSLHLACIRLAYTQQDDSLWESQYISASQLVPSGHLNKFILNENCYKYLTLYDDHDLTAFLFDCFLALSLPFNIKRVLNKINNNKCKGW